MTLYRPTLARLQVLRTGGRKFSSTPARRVDLGNYHYSEGPRSNLPFNPLDKFFAVRYIGFCVVGFGLPFAIAVWQTKKKNFL